MAHCSNVLCSSASTGVIDTTGSESTALTIGADGLGLISYQVFTADRLQEVHCDDIECSTATSHIVGDDSQSAKPNITISTDGLGIISYEGIDTIGTDGLPLISYVSETDNLKVVHCASTLYVPYQRRR